ncbi:MAG: hypothetical protein U0103_26110 [Candidatus Obscuribacterales bacterium]|nr:hypothetical protein [Cyanobacteria bacterium SZAS LIN-5]
MGKDSIEHTLEAVMANSNKTTKRALRFQHDADWRTALLELNAAIEEDPQYWHGYWVRGMVHASMENYLEAISDFTKVLQQPNRLNSRNKIELLKRIAAFATKLADQQKAERDRTQPGKCVVTLIPSKAGRISQIGRFLFDSQDIAKLNQLVAKGAVSGSTVRELSTRKE